MLIAFLPVAEARPARAQVSESVQALRPLRPVLALALVLPLPPTLPAWVQTSTTANSDRQ